MPRPAKEKMAPVEISVTANERLTVFCAESRIKKSVLTRLVMWFLAQPDFVRRVALGEVSEGMESAYADALDELARQLRAGAPPAAPQHMNEHDDIGPPPEAEPLKPPGASPASRPVKPGRPRGTPLPPTRGGVLPGGRLH